jgi:hypothetical protein
MAIDYIKSAIRRIERMCEELRKMGFTVSTVDMDKYENAVSAMARKIKSEVEGK